MLSCSRPQHAPHTCKLAPYGSAVNTSPVLRVTARHKPSSLYSAPLRAAACEARQTHHRHRVVLSAARNPDNPQAGGEKYRGVSFETAKGKWRASIFVNGTRHPLGFFTDQKEAARAYDRKAVELKGALAKLNFPEDAPTLFAEFGVESKTSDDGKRVSKYPNVTWDKSRNKWKAIARIGGKTHHLAYFVDEDEAGRQQKILEKERRAELAREGDGGSPSPTGAKRPTKTSKFRGVSKNNSTKKWDVLVSHDNHAIRLGPFDTEEEAARAYDAKAKELNFKAYRLNFPDE